MNQYQRIVYTSLLGIGSGFFGGLLGISGTIIMIPLFVLFNIFADYQKSIGTVLFGFEPVGSIFALIQYAKENRIDYLIGINIALSYMLGSYIGAKYKIFFNEKSKKNMTAIILLILSMYMFYNAYKIKVK
jgi:uncharacterized membrane protein YfcA